jgi:hypothetical protein
MSAYGQKRTFAWKEEGWIGRRDCRSYQDQIDLASSLFSVFGANGPAVWAAHDESATYRGAAFVDAAVHPGTIHCHAPAVVVVGHNQQPAREARSEVGGNVVLGLQHHDHATADGIAVRAVGWLLELEAARVHGNTMWELKDGNGRS